MKVLLKSLVFFCLCNQVFANTDSTLRMSNAIYEGDIRTVRLYQAESGFNFPMVSLSNPINELNLEFDQLSAERDYYQVAIIHCDAQWNKSPLVKTQYVEGTGFDNIDANVFSISTLTKYVHYSIPFPTEQTRPKLAGNYVLVVYRNFNENDIVLSRRFMVLNVKGNVKLNINQSSEVEFRNQNQQVNFEFNTLKDYYIPNPYQDLTAVVLQNGDWMTALSDIKPQFIQNQTYTYNQVMGNQFPGNNEFRYFDIRSLRLTQAWVKKRMNIGNQKHVWLMTDKSRAYDRYMVWKDFNGRVYYDNRDIFKDTTSGTLGNQNGVANESDYCFVHFTLEADPLEDDVYVYGELSDWRVNENCKMYYNSELKSYEAVIPLKQGYYNYMYGVVNKKTGKLEFKFLEGTHSQAENNYMVLMYHKNQQGLPIDELIGYGLGNSQGKKN